jgi:hypothetical protein
MNLDSQGALRMEGLSTLSQNVHPVISLVPRHELKAALEGSLSDARESVEKIERCFRLFPGKRWSDDLLATFFRSWKATHLKMLAIYGLSCRLQRLATAQQGEVRDKLLTAGAKNAETSYEDLGLDFDGNTHAELYDALAAAFLPETPWPLDRYLLPEAAQFQRWIYRNMVVEDVAVGLLTNMFSEIYNHGEYCMALPAFSAFADLHYDFTEEEKDEALTYIRAHIEDDTEIGHFLVVVDALEIYDEAVLRTPDFALARRLFTEYLTRLGSVMDALSQRMLSELAQDGQSVPATVQAGAALSAH